MFLCINIKFFHILQQRKPTKRSLKSRKRDEPEDICRINNKVDK